MGLNGLRADVLPLLTGADSATCHLVSAFPPLGGEEFQGPMLMPGHSSLSIHWGPGKSFISVLL